MIATDSRGYSTVYGFAPDGTIAVSAGGENIPMTGRFFVASLPRSAKSVTFTTSSGTQTLAVGA